jgi:hypothetical protein
MFREIAENGLLSLETRGGLGWRHGHWGMLADTMLVNFVRHTTPRRPPVRWYTRIDPRSPQAPISGRLLARYLPLVARLAGLKLPASTYVPLEQPTPIVEWLRSELDAGETPHLYTEVSMAMAVVERAQQLGLDLQGVQFAVGSEPLTEARQEFITSSGAEVVVTYGSKESGPMAYGCLQPAAVDDVHLYDDSYALVQRDPEQVIDDHPPTALYLTALRPSWPYLMINASVGDRAEQAPARCGCPLEALGWGTRLQSVRSFARLKLAQLAIPDDLLVTVVERELPSWFGGRAGDYQLVEDQIQVDGRPRLRLLVNATVGAEPVQIRERLLQAMRDLGVPIDQLARDQRWMVVERGGPVTTPAGKVYPIYHAGFAPGERVEA